MNMRWTKPYLPQPWLWLTLALTVLLVIAACGPATTPTPAATATPTPLSTPTATSAPITTPQASTPIEVSAQNLAFDKKTISVPAGAKVTVVFTNKESVPHNIAIYETAAATKAIFIGEVISGPRTVTYQFTAPTTPGTYFFHCDVHPGIMTGSFVVTSTGGSSSGDY